VSIYCTEFYPNVKRKSLKQAKISFAPTSEVRCTLHRFLRNP